MVVLPGIAANVVIGSAAAAGVAAAFVWFAQAWPGLAPWLAAAVAALAVGLLAGRLATSAAAHGASAAAWTASAACGAARYGARDPPPVRTGVQAASDARLRLPRNRADDEVAGDRPDDARDVARSASLSDLARSVFDLSVSKWGDARAVVLIGRDAALAHAQCRMLQFAQADSPVLITGETGTGKELFARALYLLSARRGRPLLCINCAQYHDSQLLVSELFGHKKGAFTGAVADRGGIFEEADLGTVMLDEVADLSLAAQAMLLRTLSEGEVVRVGESRPRVVNVRVIAATSRPLEPMIAAGEFRRDLFFRLRFLRLHIPSLRERGDDAELMREYELRRLNRLHRRDKRFVPEAIAHLRAYDWPGNVRELKGIVELAFLNAPGEAIEPKHFLSELAERAASPATAPAPRAAPSDDEVARCLGQLHRGDNFWSVVHDPFMKRELNRSQVMAVIAAGLVETRGSYKRLLPLLGIESHAYLKFMDFLRHHRLKPRGEWRQAT
jgi:transcriptional regulator with GAF, ATPase, and Fis domain